MLSEEAKPTGTRLCKANPQVKLPTPAVLHTLSPGDVKMLKLVLADAAEYVDSDLFARPEAEHLLRRPIHVGAGLPKANSDDSGIYALGGAEQAVYGLEREAFLFLRLNYCRMHVFRLLREHAGRRLGMDATHTLLRWEHAVQEVRGEITRENVPLVLAMAKRTRISGIDLSDLISDGNMALLRAVNKFDASRGYRFSTYACRAILKSFSRLAARMSRHRMLFPTEFDPALEKGDPSELRRENAEGDAVHELKAILGNNGAQLSDVEKTVIQARFALTAEQRDAGKGKTLEQVGQMIGVTKERVRQIQNKALGKLRSALEQEAFTR
jgi:RNA polymerase primary sigma factor